MGTIHFLDEGPFPLELQQRATAGAVTTNVLATLPVFSLGPQRQLHEIHLTMSIGQARHLAGALTRAAGMADMNQHGTSR
jgi:hypothetical protein